MQDSLWKVPNDFSRKYDFPELTFCYNAIKEQKLLLVQLDEVLEAAEKGFRAQAAFLQFPSARSSGGGNERIHDFIEMQQLLAARFSKYSVELATLRGVRVSKLTNNVAKKYKAISQEITKVRAPVTDLMDRLMKEVREYGEKVKKLTSDPTRLEREAVDIDARVDRTWKMYLQFRTQFTDFCRARENIFQHADALVKQCSIGTGEIIDRAIEIEGSLFDVNPKKKTTTSGAAEANGAFGLWESPRRTARGGSDFKVTVDRKVETGTREVLTSDEAYTLVAADGDMWTISDARGKEWEVPAECIIPIPRRRV